MLILINLILYFIAFKQYLQSSVTWQNDARENELKLTGSVYIFARTRTCNQLSDKSKRRNEKNFELRPLSGR